MRDEFLGLEKQGLRVGDWKYIYNNATMYTQSISPNFKTKHKFHQQEHLHSLPSADGVYVFIK